VAPRFKAELDGVGHLLRDQWLSVPLGQRAYAWGLEQVRIFWSDLREAHDSEYFIGTIVLTPGRGNRMQIIDGQQRLATTAMVIAAIRDVFDDRDDKRAVTTAQRYLVSDSLETAQPEPRIQLNTEDDIFFRSRVMKLQPAVEVARPAQSNRRIEDAYAFLRSQVAAEAEAAGKQWTDKMLGWLDFIDQRLRAIVVNVSSDADAFLIFETLNDRSIDLNISDLLKNYLLGQARNRLEEAERRWSRSRAALEVDDQDTALSSFIRHYWSSTYGATREKELYRRIRGQIGSSKEALQFLERLESAAPLYAALLDSKHPKWLELGVDKSEADTLLRLGIEQNRPLLLAAMELFRPEELSQLVRSIIAWTVRGLIVGGIGGGTAERFYADAATTLRREKQTSAIQVYRALEGFIVTDSEFAQQFERARPRNLRLVGYYLASLEHALRGSASPAMVSDVEEGEFEVAKVFGARALAADWPQFEQEDIPTLSYQLGNAVLLEPQLVAPFVAAGWAGRKRTMAQSRYATTRAVADFEEWGPDQMDQRQRDLADVAVRVWPRTPG
jgi:Protein of unknown function DUF262/Protein of unknown function (DUF1524)